MTKEEKQILTLGILALAVIISGLSYISTPMTPKEIDDRIKECQEYSLDYKVYRNLFSGIKGISAIYCIPKEKND